MLASSLYYVPRFLESVAMDHDERVGSTLAGYQIEGVIGRGGMGIVYRAVHLGLSRPVALKILPDDLSSDDTFRRRFVRESHLSASLDHPNIVPVFDAGEADGTLYLSMRLIDGPDLRAVTDAEGLLHPERTLAILKQIASALDAAHARGLVHRDVKPQNILVERRADGEERAYLTDFGLTRRTKSHSGMTATGMFLGTVHYSSPEQIQNQELDGRSDVYSLGCVAFELLSGRVPFDKGSDIANLYAHLGEVPPLLAEVGIDAPQAVEIAIRRAMAIQREERYTTAGEFGSALADGWQQRRDPTVVGPREGGFPPVVPPYAAPTQGLAPTSPPGGNWPVTPQAPSHPQGQWQSAPQSPSQPQGNWPTTPQWSAPGANQRANQPRSGTRWGLVLGLLAVVLLGVAALVIWQLTKEEAPSTTAGEAPGGLTPGDFNTSGSTVPLPPATITASNSAAPGIEASGAAVDYEAGNVLDGEKGTAWRVPGDGVGETLTLSYSDPVLVSSIGLLPGYAKVDPTDQTDRFVENRRVLAVEYEFSDGTVVPQSFAETRLIQSISVEEVTDEIVIRIIETTDDGGRDFTPISEVDVSGYEN